MNSRTDISEKRKNSPVSKIIIMLFVVAFFELFLYWMVNAYNGDINSFSDQLAVNLGLAAVLIVPTALFDGSTIVALIISLLFSVSCAMQSMLPVSSGDNDSIININTVALLTGVAAVIGAIYFPRITGFIESKIEAKKAIIGLVILSDISVLAVAFFLRKIAGPTNGAYAWVSGGRYQITELFKPWFFILYSLIFSSAGSSNKLRLILAAATVIGFSVALYYVNEGGTLILLLIVAVIIPFIYLDISNVKTNTKRIMRILLAFLLLMVFLFGMFGSDLICRVLDIVPGSILSSESYTSIDNDYVTVKNTFDGDEVSLSVNNFKINDEKVYLKNGFVSFFVDGSPRLLLSNGSVISGNSFKGKLIKRVAILYNDPNIIDAGGQLGYAIDAIKLGGAFGTDLSIEIYSASADFIFPFMVMKFGMIFSLIVAVCYPVVYAILMKNCLRNRDKAFECVLVTCIATCFLFQALIQIGGSTNYMVLFGIGIPFLSKGGSQFVIWFALMAVALYYSCRTLPSLNKPERIAENG